MRCMAGSMLDTQRLIGQRVYLRHPVEGDEDAVKKLGRAHACVFHPTEARCVGLLVKRPDAALMFRRPEVFAPLCALELRGDAIVVPEGIGALGKQALRDDGITLDECVLWVGMPVACADGTPIGLVGSVSFEEGTGRVANLRLGQGAATEALLGTHVVPADIIRGFRRGAVEGLEGEHPGAILVDDAAKEAACTDGLAAAAGRATALTGAKLRRTAASATPAVKQATRDAGKAVSKAAFTTGRQLGRATGMFAAFKEEFDKARNDEDER